MTYYNLRTLVVGAVIAILVAGVISYFASANPDGLEKGQEELGVAGPAHPPVEVPAVAFQEYNLKWIGEGFWSNAIAGVVGAMVVLAILLGVGRLLARGKAKAPGAAGT
jgi:cobalt/nickel transport protein